MGIRFCAVTARSGYVTYQPIQADGVRLRRIAMGVGRVVINLLVTE
jgi:hypothetical protein